MLAEQDGDITHKWDIAHHAANNVVSLKVILSLGIQALVVARIIVAFGQELRALAEVLLALTSPEPGQPRVAIALTQPQTFALSDAQWVCPCL